MIAQIEYANGHIVSLEAARQTDYYVRRYKGANGRNFAQRLNGASAKQLLNSFDFACNENGARMLQLDESMVSWMRNRY